MWLVCVGCGLMVGGGGGQVGAGGVDRAGGGGIGGTARHPTVRRIVVGLGDGSRPGVGL